MAIIKENSLKAEETRSGYDGTEQDVDIFLQGDGDDYPGRLPWGKEPHADKPAETEEPELEVLGAPKEETIDEEQDRLDAIFGGDFEPEEDPLFGRQTITTKKEETINSDKLEADGEDALDRLYSEKFEDGTEEQNLSARKEFELEEHGTGENRNSVDRDDYMGGTNKSTDEIAEGVMGDSDFSTSKIETGGAITVDISQDDLSELSDLRESLKGELKVPVSPAKETAQPAPPEKPFMDVKDDPKAKTINIPDLERASGTAIPDPQSAAYSSNVSAEEPPAKTGDELHGSERNTPAGTPEGGSKKKRFMWIAGIAAAILIAVSALGYYYLSDLFTAKPQSQLDSNSSFLGSIADKLGLNKDAKAPAGKREGKVKKVEYDKERAAKRLDSKVQARESQKEQTIAAAAPIVASPKPKEEVAPQPQRATAVVKPEASKIIIIEKPKTPAPKPKAATPKPRTAVYAPPKKEAAKAPAPKKATLRPIPMPSVASTERQSDAGEGVFTVQVYSTPSREVAEQILNRLLRRNVAGAYISKQNVREVTYYRIRFGKYSSQDQARQAANRAGFPQSWIDRIK